MQQQYDLVFFEHVLLEMPERTILERAIKNAADALKPGGKLVISDMHPFAPSSHPKDMRVPADFTYFSSGAPFEIPATSPGGEVTYYKDCHWTLSDITQAITKAGLVITEIREPLPSDADIAQHPEHLTFRLEHPMAIMFAARKM
jgi:SAM-dependent methyltransferase